MLLKLLACFWFSSMVMQTCCSTMDVTAIDPTVSTITNYQFSIQNTDQLDIPINSIIAISFPTDYLSVLASGSYSCISTSWFQAVTLSCSLSGLVLTVSGGFPVARPFLGQDDQFDFIVYGIKNPPYATYTDVFNGEFDDANGNQVITMQSNGGSGILISSGTMSCSLTSSPTTVSSKAILTVAITPSHNIPSDGQIVLTTNTYWTRDILNSTDIFDATLQCSAGAGAANNLGCSLFEDVIDSILIVTITNILTATSNNPFSFTMSPFYMPPTTQPQGSFTIQSQSSSGSVIDVCSGVKLSTVTAGQLSSPSFSMTSTTINSITQGNLTFKLGTAILISDTVVVTFPAALTLSITNITMTSGNRQISNYTVIGQILTFTIGTGTQNFQASTIFTLLINSIVNPTSTATTGSFSIQTTRSNYNIDTLTQSLTYTATSGVFSASLTASVLQIGAGSQYTLTVNFTDSITSSGVLYITFPSVFTMVSGTYSCTSNQSSSVACSYSAANRIMTVNSISQTTISANSSVTLVISGIVNPISVGAFQSLSLMSTFSGSSDTVDTVSSGLSLTLITRGLSASNVVLTSSSMYVYTIASFTFTITNQNPLPANSILYVVLPSDITYSNSYTCMRGVLSVSCSNSTIDSQVAILVSLGNSATIAASGLATTPIVINNLYTPTSTKQTSTFKLYLVYSDGTRSEQLTDGLFFAATNPSAFSVLQVTSNSSQNYHNPTSFVVSVTTPFPLQNSTVLKITFPNVMSTTATCTAVSSSLQTPVCTNNSNILSIVLQFNTSPVTSVVISLDNMINYPSLASYSVMVSLLSSDLIYQISQGTYSLQNQLPNSITLNSWSFSSNIMKDSSSSLSIDMKLTVPLGISDYVLITFPSQFILTNPTCTLTNQLACIYPTSQTIKITATGAIFPSQIVVSISGITNPAVSPSSNVFLESYTSSNNLCDQDYTIQFSTICLGYCRTCLTTNTSYCLSCYTDSTLVSGNIFLSNNNCTSNCLPKYYYNSTTSACSQCSTNCSECINYSNCTTCPATYYLYSQMCVSSCPLGYYNDNVTQSCLICTVALHCQTCANSLYCSSCTTGYFLYGNYCVSSCPSLITTEDSFNRVCQPCPINCSQCSGSTFVTCTMCNIGYLLDQGGCYLSCQTPNTVPSVNGLTCSSCSSICLTCAITQYNCLSCNTSSVNKYLFSNNCLSSCGNGYYNNDNLNTCTQCNSPCETCLNSSMSSCLTCVANSYLYGTVCILACPSEYFLNGSVCSACQSPCKQCTSATICTSCISGKVLYLTNCNDNCPNNTVNQNDICVTCSINCQTCESATNLCASCYPTNYLLNGVCYQDCPTLYYANDTTQQCEKCISPCLTCSSSSVCQTCVTSYSLDGTSCNTSCSNNKISINQVCTACDGPCLTCVVSTSNCTSCQSGLLYNQQLSTCTSSCQAGYYKLATNSTCVQVCPQLYYTTATECVTCPPLCIECTSSINCSACSTGNYYYSNMCYSACPAQAPFSSADGHSCVTCSVANCLTCSSTLCITCNIGYLLIDRTSCIISCPVNETYNATSLKCQTIITPNNTNTTNSTTNNSTSTDSTSQVKLSFVPFPYLIVTLVVVIVVGVGKLQHQQMRFAFTVLPFVSFFAYLAAVTNCVVAILSSSSLTLTTDIYLLFAGISLIIVLNLLNALFVCTDLRKDGAYTQFFQKHKCGVVIIMFLSLITPFKWIQILYSNCFGFAVFSLMLSQQQFTNKFNALQWVSIVTSATYIVSGCMNALTSNYSKYVFYGGIELIILSLFEIALTIASNKSSQSYELKYKETLTHQQTFQPKIDQIESQNEIYSQNNIKDLSHEALNSNHLNIFDVIGPQVLEDAKVEERRAQSVQTPKQKTEQSQIVKDDDMEYKSTMEYNRKDPLRVEKRHIEQAIEEGVFRHNAKSILEIKKKEEDESALADAVKLYHLEMRRKTEMQGINHRDQKVSGIVPTNEEMIIQQDEQDAHNQQPTNVELEKVNLETDGNNQAENEQLKMIIFDDEEDQRSVPTHISREISTKRKRLNSLGSLALIIEEEVQPVDQINLDSDRLKEKQAIRETIPEEETSPLPPKPTKVNRKTSEKKEGKSQDKGQNQPVQKEQKKIKNVVQHTDEPIEKKPLQTEIVHTQLQDSIKGDRVVPSQIKTNEPLKIVKQVPAQTDTNKYARVEKQLTQSQLIDEGSEHQHFIEASKVNPQKPANQNQIERIQVEKADKQHTRSPKLTPQYDNDMEDEQIATPAFSKVSQNVHVKNAPDIKTVKPKQESKLPSKDEHPKELKQVSRTQPKNDILLIDESSHGDMIEGYRELEVENSEDLDSEAGSSKKLVPVTASLSNHRAVPKSKLINPTLKHQTPPISMFHQYNDVSKSNDDLESIYTVEQRDYEDTHKTIDYSTMRRAGNLGPERRYLQGDQDQDLVRPSQLFKGANRLRKAETISMGGNVNRKIENTSKLHITKNNNH